MQSHTHSHTHTHTQQSFSISVLVAFALLLINRLWIGGIIFYLWQSPLWVLEIKCLEQETKNRGALTLMSVLQPVVTGFSLIPIRDLAVTGSKINHLGFLTLRLEQERVSHFLSKKDVFRLDSCVWWAEVWSLSFFTLDDSLSL